MKGLLKLSAALTVAFSLLTFLSQWHALIELFSHFRMQYLVISILLALIFLALRDHAWASGLFVVAVINSWPVANWYFAETDAAGSHSQTISLLQANVYGGNNNTTALLELIEREQPDLIFLQEVTAIWIAAMQQLEERYPHNHAIPRTDNFGIAVYSRAPLLAVEVVDSPPMSLPTLVATQSINDQTVTFVTTHPFPPMGGEWTDARNRQLDSLGELMNSIDSPKVLVGDLNITMWAHHYRKLTNATGLRNARKGFGVIPTWPRQLPFALIPIDHCLVSDEFAVLDFRTGPSSGSDHLPVIIKLGL